MMTSFKRQRLSVSEEDGIPGTEEYEVFLSFRGPDTRQGFADVLYDCMDRAGIRVFRDDDELAIGDKIDKILLALNNSEICVPIFSKTFAESRWCLTEVSKMVELNKDVVPIFYNVTPDDVDLKTPAYEESMAKHVNRYGNNIVEKWEAALKYVTKLKGREVLSTSYTKFCKTFVEELLIKLKPRKRYDLDNLVGMDNRLDSAMKLLDIGSGGVRYILIHGMGGIGKTTLAKVIFDKVSASFHGYSFMENLRESSKREGLDNLQKKLSDSLDPKPASASNISKDVRERFRGKKVLIILDDVDAGEQVEHLVGKSSFASGSRIIITTRNANVLNECEDSSVQSLEMGTLQDDEALQLFKIYAFRKDSAPAIFEGLSKEAISTTGGLPLAIKVIASLLRGKNEGVWRDVITRSKKIPPKEVKNRLKISYDALEDEQKQMFLDIACIFRCRGKSDANYMWEACDLHPTYGLEVLMSMSLVKITNWNIWMHDQLRDLGRDIVREENINDPTKRSRIWLPEDAVKVLEGKRGKKKVEALSLRLPQKMSLTREQCAGFRNLRFLEIEWEGVQLEGDCEGLWPELKWLSWRQCTSDFKVSHSFSKNLVILDLSESSIDENWGGWSILIQMAVNLKVLELKSCKNLTRTPDFSKHSSLESLILRGCMKLAEIGSSIGNLRRLKFLDVRTCYSLRSLPEELGSLEDLKEIHVSGKSQTFSLPNSVGSLKSLLTITLESLRIDHVPASIGELARLKHFVISVSDPPKFFLEGSRERVMPESLGNIKSLVELDLSGWKGTVPTSIGGLQQLKQLNVKGCYGIDEVFDSLRYLKSLVRLDLSDTEISNLPDSIGDLQELQELHLSGCCKITKLPESIGRLNKLVKLNAGGCGSLEEIPLEIGGLSSLRKLTLSGSCIHTLPSTIKQLTLLEELDLKECRRLQELPEFPPSLTTLIVSSVSCLQKVHDLPSSGQTLAHDVSSFRSTDVLHDPNRLDTLKNLTNLKKLELTFSNYAPTKLLLLSSLTQLESLSLTLEPLPSGPSIVEVELPRLSNLKNLSSVRFTNFLMEDGLVDNLGVEELERLEVAWIENCSAKLIEAVCLAKSLSSLDITDCRVLPDLSHLRTRLRRLTVLRCGEITRVSGLEELDSLDILRIIKCGSVERLGNLSKLKKLSFLYLSDCPALTSIEGIEGGLLVDQLVIEYCDSLQNVDALLRRSKFGEHHGRRFVNVM